MGATVLEVLRLPIRRGSVLPALLGLTMLVSCNTSTECDRLIEAFRTCKYVSLTQERRFRNHASG